MMAAKQAGPKTLLESKTNILRKEGERKREHRNMLYTTLYIPHYTYCTYLGSTSAMVRTMAVAAGTTPPSA